MKRYTSSSRKAAITTSVENAQPTVLHFNSLP